MSVNKKIILITSRDNFVWTSMQEIIPMIEHTWAHLCVQENYDLQIINIDEETLAKHLHRIIAADLLVVTCFNTKIAKAIKVLREKFQIDTRLFFYLHGLATIGLWPLQRFEVLNLLTTNDLFIGTCEGDIKSTQLTFDEVQVAKIPFTLMNLPAINKRQAPRRPFAFIGRISPQKNLDHLIEAYSQLSEEIKLKHPLIFFGSEDHLGYPNAGVKEKNYLNKLQELVTKLKLNEFVTFRGFVDRIVIQEELGNNYIFVSPSTHSDENFGMAAFRALLTGVPCVLTSWGGHAEFNKYYAKQIKFISPLLKKNRPGIDLTELTQALEEVTKIDSLDSHNYSEELALESIVRKLKTCIELPLKPKSLLKPTGLALTIYNQQKEFEALNEIQQCFKSFEDPAFIAYFEAYSVICLK